MPLLWKFEVTNVLAVINSCCISLTLFSIRGSTINYRFVKLPSFQCPCHRGGREVALVSSPGLPACNTPQQSCVTTASGEARVFQGEIYLPCVATG